MLKFWSSLKSDWSKLSNLLTELRFVLSPLPGILLLLGYWFAATVLFLIIVITDLLDGYFARTRDEITDLGKTLDPIADSLFAVFTLVSLLLSSGLVAMIICLPVAVFIIRDISVGMLLSLAKRRGVEVQVVKSGKIKTVLLAVMMFLSFILIGFDQYKFGSAYRTEEVAYVLLVLLTLVAYSALQFSLISWREYHKLYSLPRNNKRS